MAYMALCILDDPDRLEHVLNALAENGIQGATIIESTGLHRHQKKLIPMRYLYASPQMEASDNLTILMLVKDRKSADKALAAIESVVGDLNQPHTGIFAVWPITLVKGLGGMIPKGKA
jgi:nitrogen regulatory protein P-II 1